MLTAAVGFGVLMSCQRLPLLAPSGSSITLTAATNVLPVNGSVPITAVVLGGTEGSTGTGTGGTGGTAATSGTGQPVHNGTVVTFTTTLGTLQPSTAKTQNGQVTVMLVGNGQSGVAKVTAFSGAANANISINVGSAAAARITVTASPQTLPASGGTSTIVANVQDQQGNGLLGVPVSFSTNAGTLGATSVLTDTSGFATTSLTTAGTATVTASAGGGTTGNLTPGTVTVNVNPKTLVTVTPPAASLGLSVSSPATFTIAISSSGGSGSPAPTITGLAIDFGDGQTLPLDSGTTSIVHLYGSSGVFTVTATATDSTGAQSKGTAQVAIAPLTASVAVTSQDNVNHSATFTVTTSTNAFIDHFSWDFGDGQGVNTTSNVITHNFAFNGPKNISVTVVPQVGSPKTVSVSIIFP